MRALLDWSSAADPCAELEHDTEQRAPLPVPWNGGAFDLSAVSKLNFSTTEEAKS